MGMASKGLNFRLTFHPCPLKCPVLILGGEADFVTAAIHSEEMHRAMPQSELHIVERASHSVFSDRPDYVFPVIEDFVKRTYSAKV